MPDSKFKCPSCGFECLETDRHCLMCGIDFMIFEDSVKRDVEKNNSQEIEKKKENEKDVCEPDSGTESKLRCPSCGFDRQETDKHCLMCGIDFKIYEDAMKKEAEKEGVKEEKTSGQPVFAGDSEFIDEFSDSGQFVMEFEEKGDVIGSCIKCGAKRFFGDYECRGCGIVFSKIEAAKKVSEEDEDLEYERESPLRKIFDILPGIFAFFAALIKAVLSLITKLLSLVYGAAKETAPAAASSLWRVRKPFIHASVFFVFVFVLYYSGRFTLNKYHSYKADQSILAKEKAINEAAERFRVNACTIKDSIFKTAEIGDIDKALSMFSEYDLPVLKFNPIMLWIKDGLDEMVLNEKILTIPYDDYEERYRAYERLYEIDPAREEYSTSLDAYKHLLAGQLSLKASGILRDYKKDKAALQKGIATAERALSLVPSQENRDLVFRAKSEMLLFYEGNENVAMALRDDGFSGKTHTNQRKIRVWIKNIGSDPFRINPDFFVLICDDGARYQYNDFSKDFVTEILPGSEIEGDVFFYTKAQPKRLIFDHVSKGMISRDLP